MMALQIVIFLNILSVALCRFNCNSLKQQAWKCFSRNPQSLSSLRKFSQRTCCIVKCKKKQLYKGDTTRSNCKCQNLFMSRPGSSCEINPAKRLTEDDINYFSTSIASYDAYFSVLSQTITACFLLNAPIFPRVQVQILSIFAVLSELFVILW